MNTTHGEIALSLPQEALDRLAEQGRGAGRSAAQEAAQLLLEALAEPSPIHECHVLESWPTATVRETQTISLVQIPRMRSPSRKVLEVFLRDRWLAVDDASGQLRRKWEAIQAHGARPR